MSTASPPPMHARSRILAHAHPPGAACERVRARFFILSFEYWLPVSRFGTSPSQLLALSALFQCARLSAGFECSPCLRASPVAARCHACITL